MERRNAEHTSTGPEAVSTSQLPSLGGVVAALEQGVRGDVIAVRDARGRLLVEVQEDGTVALHVAEGDLVLRSATGRVRIEGAEGVHLTAPRVTIEAARMRQVVGVMETHARRIVEKAKDAYRDVEGISQTRAGQVRIVAKQTFRAIAERVRMRASKDAKVQADKIYLG